MASRKKLFVIGDHRSFELAQRHARQLARQYSEGTAKADVRIIARRNYAGKFSKRGHLFTFEILLPAKREFLLTFKFSRGKANRMLHVEAVVIGSSLAEIQKQIYTRRFERKNFRFVQWTHGHGKMRKSENWHDFEKFVIIAETIDAENR